ncbi:nuclear transport factor 2 family protein [bacterium]|nr:MAG: nuclear transport factor 2 family protein [bacterium]
MLSRWIERPLPENAEGTKPDVILAPWNDLVAAERAFSADASARGVRSAFLTAFAPNALILGRNDFRNGPAFYRSIPDDRSTKLVWSPEKAEINSDGTLGYTTGPYEVSEADGKLTRGRFLSVWKREPGGWKVALDVGAPIPAPAPLSIECFNPARSVGVASSSPYDGKTAYLPDALRTEPGTDFRPSGSLRRGDLAATWGKAVSARGGRKPFVRIWRTTPQGKWSIAVEAIFS